MSSIADSILTLPPALALALVFLLPALEASIFVGLVVPGEIGVLLGGVLANQHKVSLTAVLILGIAGAIIGDSVGFEVGKRYGEKVLSKIPDRILDEEKLRKTEGLIRRYGGRSVFIGRFTSVARALVPGLAGMGGIPYRKFVVFNVLGGAIWAGAFALLGYAVGSQYHVVEHNATLVGIGILVVVAILIGVHYLRKRHHDDAGAGDRKAGDRDAGARAGQRTR